MAVTVNLSELARRYGKSVNTVAKWPERGCPVVEKGGHGQEWRFDPAAVDGWRAAGEAAANAEEARRAEASAGLDLEAPQSEQAVELALRERYYRSEKARRELDKERGFLVTTAEVRQEFIDTLGYISDRLQALPDLIERRCSPAPEVVELIAETIDEWQAVLAERLERVDELGGDEARGDLFDDERRSA